MISPHGNIPVRAVAWVGRYRFRSGAESGERDHAVGIIVAEHDRLYSRPPFHELASTDIIAVARGVTLCIRHRGG